MTSTEVPRRNDVSYDRGNAVKNTVRNMVSNLENVITNLQGVVGDLRVLVHQIEAVTNQLDDQYGVQWKQNGRNDWPGLQNKNATAARDVDTTGLTRWQKLIDNIESPDYSPDIDWSYLGLTGFGDILNHEKIHVTSTKFTSAQLPSTRINNPARPDTTDLAFDFGVETKSETRPYSQVQNSPSGLPNSGSESSGSDSSPCSMSSSTSSSMSATSHVFCDDITGGGDRYCGFYEVLMESQLEKLHICDVDSSFSDAEDEVLSMVSSDACASYDRKVNPWKSFGLVHIDSAQESDEVISESASDILNDNYIDSTFTYTNPGFDGDIILF